jgi:hypothetical protein
MAFVAPKSSGFDVFSPQYPEPVRPHPGEAPSLNAGALEFLPEPAEEMLVMEATKTVRGFHQWGYPNSWMWMVYFMENPDL